MSATIHRHATVFAAATPSTPRLQLEPTGSSRTLLDGGWWPRSTDPVAELPGLVLAIDAIRGPVTRLVLSAAGWDEHPGRLSLNGRILRLGYFTSQSTFLVTAICGYNGERVDLLVIPPDTPTGSALAAMALAASAANRVQAPDILLAAGVAPAGGVPAGESDRGRQATWETDGGAV